MLAERRPLSGDELLFAVTHVRPDVEIELFILAPPKSPAEQLPD